MMIDEDLAREVGVSMNSIRTRILKVVVAAGVVAGVAEVSMNSIRTRILKANTVRKMGLRGTRFQ